MAGLTLKASFPDIAQTRAAVEAAAASIDHGVAEDVAHGAQPILQTTKALTPYDPTGDPGHIRDSLTTTVAGATIAIIASHPGAIIHEFGGTIRPHGAPIRFREHAMARRAAATHLPEIERAIEARIERLI